MRALTVLVGAGNSARLDDLPEPAPKADTLLIRGIAVGVYGTDREITAGGYGWAPPGRDRLVLGDESVGRVLEAWLTAASLRETSSSAWCAGPAACAACALDQWAMCRNGRYTDHESSSSTVSRERYLLAVDAAVAVPEALGELAVLVDQPALSPKRGTTSTASGRRPRGFLAVCSSPAPAPSASSAL